MKTKITVESTVKAPVDKIWESWNTPAHITKWATASEEWHTPSATNDLHKGGKFLNRMEAKDGSMGFDFTGVYDEVVPNKRIAYTLEDGRKVEILFKEKGKAIHITQTFDAETENPVEMQREGWQAILDNFKKYTEKQFAH